MAAKKKVASTAVKKTAKKKVTKKKAVAKKAADSPSSEQAVKKTSAKAKTSKKATAKKAQTATGTKSAKSNAMSTPSQNTDQTESFVPYVVGKDEDYMNEEQKNHFRKILTDWRLELMQEVDRTVDHMKDDAMNFPDPNDRATQEEEFSLELRTRDRERKLIKKIGQALDDIDDDNYGYCEACGIEIGVKRLEARPTATQCIDCKTLQEIKEKQTRL